MTAGAMSFTELITSDEEDLPIYQEKVYPCTLKEKGVIDGTKLKFAFRLLADPGL